MRVWCLILYHSFFTESNIKIEYESFGRLSSICNRGYGTFHFTNEFTRYKCCDSRGLGSFLGHSIIPEVFLTLLQNKHFRAKIRHYNNTFQMATLGATKNSSVFISHSFPFYMKVNDTLYHALPAYQKMKIV